MIAANKMQKLLTIALLTYFYIVVVFMFQNSRYSTWQRFAKDMLNDTIVSDKDQYYDNYSNMTYNNGDTAGDPMEPEVDTFRVATAGNGMEYFSDMFSVDLHPVSEWIRHRQSQCNQKFTGYGKLFAHLREVVIDPEKGKGRPGGEDMKTVMNQKENREYWELNSGYFQTNCEGRSLFYEFEKKDHLRKWMASTKSSVVSDAKDDVSELTIAVTRYEYVNMYHTMTDLYNIFLMLIVFKTPPEKTNILWIDGHPKGDLDPIWRTLFGRVHRAGELLGPTYYKDLVWGMTGYNSLLNLHSKPDVPYLEEFRDFFLKQYAVRTSRTLDCNRLSILFIWRRDYVAHPRNPKGKVGRKIKNEDELLRKLTSTFPEHSNQGVQMDLLAMKDQLEIISKTDILIGMHGAGLTLSLMLPPQSALIELYPTYWSTRNEHFKAMAGWRRLHYRQWQNHDRKREFPNKLTYIPPHVVINMVKDVIYKLCPVQD